ncbi:hypothetical protein FIBSPDRAFT_744345 [Athelia psychrophila]|uniref:C3H1-type domain-containing protein n=1 Tax=Athelia psychrophila TaxID=1759441 RepID=A0A166HTB7_9AGAM|nr:hypothetical protein FIBSPDRAFT_744345 [Fibularhizoctonia sp. CBS 109695]
MSQAGNSPPPENNAAQTEAANAISRAALEITENYRQGAITKAHAFLQLRSAIPGADSNDEAAQVAYREALGTYIEILDGHDRFRANAAANGRVGGVGRSHSDAGSDDEERPPRRKINAAAFPWVIDELLNPPVDISPAHRQTLAAIENHSRDPKQAKASLYNAARLPQFPDSEWSHVLLGHAVDLNHVLSAMYSVSVDERQTEKLGKLEITVGATKPAKTVETHGQWVISWGSYVEAVTFVFSERAYELREYGKHITQLFASFGENLHPKVINYDRAVRIRAGQRRDILLTDFAKFSDLHVLWILGAGAGASSTEGKHRTSTSSGSGSRRKDGPCRRWNDGRCVNSNEGCEYSHICSSCRSNAHRAPNCPKSK